MISPSFLAEVERQRTVAQVDLARALAAADDSAATAARARLADLDDICNRTAEQLVLTAS